MRQQTLIWTALPGGSYSTDLIRLSVFLTPRLVTDEGGGVPKLSLFPDFVNWPETIGGAPGGPISFTVTFAGKSPVHASVISVGQLSAPRWAAIFSPPTTGVQSYEFSDFSDAPMHSYSMQGVEHYVSGLYQAFGVSNPTGPPVLTIGRAGSLELPKGSPLGPALASLENQTGGRGPLEDVAAYYQRPLVDPSFVLTQPTLDFHAAISSLAAFPVLLRVFGLVFDLQIPNPGVGLGTSTTVTVTPTWTSSFTGANSQTTRNVSPPTACTFSKAGFLPTPLGSLDYVNGMLDLADTTRFSVTDLDLDGSAQGVQGLSQDLTNLEQFESSIDELGEGSTVALTLPSLRSLGPTIVRSGWAEDFQALVTRQTASQQQLTNWLAQEPGASLPTFYAEDLVRGHRVDVYTASESSPAWRSLLARAGAYTFGTSATLPMTAPDEGAVVPAPTQAAGTVDPPPPDMWLSEAMARWTGWSLAAPRIGSQINPDDSTGPNLGNPAAPSTPDTNGAVTPQLSASFTVPPKTLPKLRFGHQYQFRARAADLAGNGLPVTSTDASTATGLVTHLRYQPVVAPVMAATTAYGPGQGTLYLALIDDQVNPVQPLGRWLIPPKVVELLVEEHGMLDGFSLGSPPHPSKPLSGAAATYDLIAGAGGAVGLNDATMADIPGVQLDPTVGAPYVGGSSLTTPWFPDPLSAGAAMLGLPGAGTKPTVRTWEPGPWPLLQPLLLNITVGPVAGHTYLPPTGGAAAVETVTLPPGEVYNVRVSSSLTTPATLGVWQWILQGLTSPAQITKYTAWARQGQIWMLTPYTTLRIVHAVRLPLVAPTFETLAADPRPYGDTTVVFHDQAFRADARSASSIDVEGIWLDPLDNPSDPSNDPTTATVASAGPAYKLTIPDPSPLGAPDAPGTVIPPQSPFALTSQAGAVHNIGDTKHHLVRYTATGSSRFAEMFAAQVATAFPDANAVVISSPPFGLNAGAVELFDAGGDQVDPSQYTVDPTEGTVTLIAGSTYIGQTLEVSYQPTITIAGPAAGFHVLSSARPRAPQVTKVSPAWTIVGPNGTVKKGLSYQRDGGFLRVYLARPWFSSGANELLGVVTLPPFAVSTQPIPDAQTKLVTMVGLDPISLADASLTVTTSPQAFAATQSIPAIVGRPAYTSPPQVALVEDATDNPYQVFPYPVHFDPVSNQWYADVYLDYPAGQTPPPGYFVRLALVRFQPYANVGAEVSPVVVATFAQPVANRAVFVSEVSPTLLRAEVTGPAYQGFRPASLNVGDGTVGELDDIDNPWSTDPYSYPGDPQAPHTSAMVVEVQVENPSSGLTGDLGWAAATSPVLLDAIFEASTVVWAGDVTLPHPVTGSTKMRLRISEIDYYQSTTAPAAVDTTFRRPFVAHIPIN